MTDGRYKIVIAGGGTGGHLYPAIAVAEEIKKQADNSDILFIGTERGIEARVLPAEKYYVKLFKTEGFVGMPLRKKIGAFFRLFVLFFEVYAFLKEVKPDIVIGTGGYASFLPVLAAFMLSIPTIIHEQNSIPGLANKLLAKIVDRVCITYESSLPYFPKSKTILTGNPVRERIIKAERDSAAAMFSLKKDKLTVFIFGGSAGAHSLNHNATLALEHLTHVKDRIQFLHQTGEKDYDQVRARYREYGFSGTVTSFIYNMPEAYATSDIIICRAGATTLAEITAVGMPSILVPYPYAAKGHQELNAARLAKSGAAIMIKDDELSGQLLAEKILQLVNDESARMRLRRNCMGFGRPDAARKVASIALTLMKVRSPHYKQEYERCLTNSE